MKKVLLLLPFVLFSFTLFAQGTWVTQTSGVTTALQSVSAVDANVCWTGGIGGVVLRTTNGGTTWTSVGGGAVIGTNDIYTVWATDANNCLVSSSPTGATFVYKTTDGGATWTQVFTQSGGFMDAIKMRSATEGIMYGDPVGGRWSIWKTTNAGTTWDSAGLYLPQVGTEAGWNNALHLDGNNVWFGTNNTKLYYSSNYGASWTAQATTGTVNTYAVWFNNATNGMAGASAMVKTTNGGANWSLLTVPGTGNVSGIVGLGSNWLTLRQTNLIYATSNDGTTWTTAYTGASSVVFYHLAVARNFADAVWAVTSTGGIVKGTNLIVPVELTSFTATSNNNGVTLNWTTATETNNRGFEIQKKSNADYVTVGFVNGNGSSTVTHNYSFTEAVQPGTYTYRLRQVDFNGNSEFSNAVEVNVVNPTEFALGQNYPNPFNPSTKINFTVAKSGLVKLAVYNLLGQQVQTLVNEVKEAGTYNVSFNASNLTSGVYFYKLETPDFSKTMKMILNK